MPITLENTEILDRTSLKLQGDGLYNICSKYYNSSLVDTVQFMQRLSYPKHFGYEGDHKKMISKYKRIDYLSNSIDGAIYFDYFLRWALTGAKQRTRVFTSKNKDNGINKTARQRINGRDGKTNMVTQSYHQYDRVKSWTQRTTHYAPRESNYFGYGEVILKHFEDKIMSYIKGEL